MSSQRIQNSTVSALNSNSRALDADLIFSYLSLDKPESIDVLDSIESTNSYLLERPISRQAARACFAESQTAGRGRHGNNWQSTPYRNIMFSLSWGFCGWPKDISALSLAIGLGVTKMLNDEYDIGASIKWPNDVLVKDAKLAGVLIDVAGHSKSDCQVVVGVGLNVDQAEWDQAIEYSWCDLRALGVKVDRNILAAKLIDVIVLVLRSFGSSGFGPMVEAWNELSAFSGRRVQLRQVDKSFDGLMLGVEADGALLIQTDSGLVQRISDSRASLRVIDI